MIDKNNKITVFYDGGCGLCSREIRHYQRISSAADFKWIDITEDAKAFLDDGYALEDGLKALHAIDHSGRYHIGVDAFLLIWKHLRYWNILSFFVSLPLIKQLARFSYKHFAAWRFKKLGYCDVTK